MTSIRGVEEFRAHNGVNDFRAVRSIVEVNES